MSVTLLIWPHIIGKNFPTSIYSTVPLITVWYIYFVCSHRNHDSRICTRKFHCHLYFTWCHVRYFAVVGRYFRLVLQKKKDYWKVRRALLMRSWRFFCLLLFSFQWFGKVRDSAARKLNRGRKRNDNEGGEGRSKWEQPPVFNLLRFLKRPFLTLQKLRKDDVTCFEVWRHATDKMSRQSFFVDDLLMFYN